MSVEAYPLSWPSGWKREMGRETSKFNTNSTKAHALIRGEVSRMGGTGMVISTNVPLKADGNMRVDREPVDGGVAVYFTRKGKQVVFACDRFDCVKDNILSIARTIEALRGIERWGASDMMERAFAGFKALAADTTENWWDVLDCRPDSSHATVQAQYKARVKAAHPDSGGSEAAMQRLNIARDAGLDPRG